MTQTIPPTPLAMECDGSQYLTRYAEPSLAATADRPAVLNDDGTTLLGAVDEAEAACARWWASEKMAADCLGMQKALGNAVGIKREEVAPPTEDREKWMRRVIAERMAGRTIDIPNRAIPEPIREEAVSRLMRGEKPGSVAEGMGLNPQVVYNWNYRYVIQGAKRDLPEEPPTYPEEEAEDYSSRRPASWPEGLRTQEFSLTSAQASELAREFSERAKLSPREREAFELTVSGADDADMAEVMGCEPATARKFLQRARIKVTVLPDVAEWGLALPRTRFANSVTNRVGGVLN